MQRDRQRLRHSRIGTRRRFVRIGTRQVRNGSIGLLRNGIAFERENPDGTAGGYQGYLRQARATEIPEYLRIHWYRLPLLLALGRGVQRGGIRGTSEMIQDRDTFRRQVHRRVDQGAHD